MVALSAILNVLLDVFLGLDVGTREDLGDIDELAVEGVIGELDGFVYSSKIGVVVTDTAVEVVVGDLRYLEGIGGLENDGTGVITGVSLENGLGEPVVLISGVNAVVREVAAEVDGATELEDIEVIAGSRTLVEHSGGETGGGVDTTVAKDGSLPVIDTGVLLVVDVEGALI